MLIVVGSVNPVKIMAVQNGFRQMFPKEKFETMALEVDSGVAAQPMSDVETLNGALQRAQAVATAHPEADFAVGIEGGIFRMSGKLAAFAWIVVAGKDRTGQARTGTFFLPPEVARLIAEGHELGAADDIVFGRTDSKKSNGAIGLLTQDVITRTTLYEHAVVLALVPFKQPALYPQEKIRLNEEQKKKMIYHIMQNTEWEQAQQAGVYAADSLKAEGFIHCSTAGQALRVADVFFRGEQDLVLLAINEDELEAEPRYENTEGGDELFPHLYGSLPVSAVSAAVSFPPSVEGNFEWPQGLERI